MFGLPGSSRGNARSVLDAVGRFVALIEFDLTGRVLWANAGFCTTLGYALSDIKGQRDRLFVTPDESRSAGYAAFWAKLGRGDCPWRGVVRGGEARPQRLAGRNRVGRVLRHLASPRGSAQGF